MPTPTGIISLADVNVELGKASTAAISMNDANVRTLAGVGGSGTIISMDNLRGKSLAVLTSPFVSSAAVTLLGFSTDLINDGFSELQFFTNGTLDYNIGTDPDLSEITGTVQATWATPSTANPGNVYYIRANLISSSGTGVDTGNFGSWLSLSTTKTFGLSQDGPQAQRVLTFNLSKDQSTILATSPQITFRAVQSTAACVSVKSYVYNYGVAGTMTVGSQLFSSSEDMLVDEYRTIKYANIETKPGVKIVTESGVTLECSTTAPIPTEFNGLVKSINVLGKRVATMRNGIRYWDMVTNVIDIGQLEVMHIFADDRCFWAGDTEGSYILHHNAKPLP